MTILNQVQHNVSRKKVTEVLIWTFAGTATILTAGRYAIRFKIFGKLRPDDYVHALALTFLMAFASISSAMSPLIQTIDSYNDNQGPLPTRSEQTRFIQLLTASAVMFWATLYTVKLAFLIFYRSIFWVSRAFMVVWWFTVGFVSVAFLSSVLGPLWLCTSPMRLNSPNCAESLHPGTDSWKIAVNVNYIWCAFSLASGLIVMALPVWMTHGLRIPIGQKVGLMALFLIGTIDMAADIARTIDTVGGNSKGPNSVSIWNALEPSLAVIASALPPYKYLLTRSREEKRASEARNADAQERNQRKEPLSEKSTGIESDPGFDSSSDQSSGQLPLEDV